MPCIGGEMLSQYKVDGLLALIGGFSLHLTLGTLYCFGNMNTYMTSYLRKHVDPAITYSDLIWIPTLSTVAQGVFMTLSGHLEELVGVRLTALAGSSIMTLGVYLTSFAIRRSLTLTVLTYGFMFGLGTALAYPPPLGVAMRWFPRQKGLVNGVIVGGFGLGAFVFNQIQSTYLNPMNEALDNDGYFTDDKILDRVPSVFLLLGSIYGVIQAMAVLLISPPDKDQQSLEVPLVAHATEDEEEVDNNEADDEAEDEESFSEVGPTLNNNNDNVNQTANDEGEINLKPKYATKSREFWLLWATFFLNTQAITYINSMYKAYGQTFPGFDDHFLAIVGACAAVFNSGGRIFWGHLCDKFGYKICMMLVSFGLAALFATFHWLPSGTKALFAVWIWAIYFCFCGNFVLLPTATAQAFGTRYSSRNYGLVMSGQAAAAPITAVMTQVLSPIIGYPGMFALISGFSMVCTIMTWRLFPKSPSPSSIRDRIQQPPAQL